jgi:hypothetical protein
MLTEERFTADLLGLGANWECTYHNWLLKVGFGCFCA